MLNTTKLRRLEKQIVSDLSCPLKDAATNLVFGKGNPDADILILGEAPGKNEDEQGLPFVGRTGQELDALLQSIGLALSDVYVCNILKYRPPRNRNPTVKEIDAHTPFLVEQIKIVKPKIILTLGNFATRFVLNNFSSKGMSTMKGISEIHGKEQVVFFQDVKLLVFPMFHPSAMLYNNKLRKTLEKDFLNVKKLLG